MKVLWLLNSMPPHAREHFNLQGNNKEGWIEGLLHRINSKETPDFQLAVAFPVKEREQVLEFSKAGIMYYSFYENTDKPEMYDASLEAALSQIAEKVKPDVIHIFGTEYPHTLAMCRGANKYRDKILIGMQGVMEIYKDHFFDGLPRHIISRKTFRDLVKRDSLIEQRDKFCERARNEVEALKLIKHVTGRTEFDKKFVKSVNPNATYHYMSETMRACFYEGSWDINSCEKNSIFLSQGNYPIKGAHYILEAMPRIIKAIPDVKLFIAGDNITKHDTLFQKIKISSYGKYLRELIEKNNLKDRVIFLGSLNAVDFKARMLKSNLHIVTSTIENSPNSIGEAELLGVPTVTCDVGGIKSIFTDGEDGIIYSGGDTYELAEAVIKVLADPDLQKEYSKNAGAHGRKLYDPEENYRTLINIYEEIAG
jgi:glycosyltransferase involved in cell wall biosynthesis